jgi:hypothetical protein
LPEETTDAAPEFEHINIDSSVTSPEGVIVPVKIAISYPANQGLWAIMALRKCGEEENINSLYQGLVRQGDESVMKALLTHADEELTGK